MRKFERNDLFYIISGFWMWETREKIWVVSLEGNRFDSNHAVNKREG